MSVSLFFFFKQKTAYEMRISDWSSDVCSSDLAVTLRVEPGEIYCLLGANGAGKTTLVNLFLDFLEPTSGEVRINGRSVSQHPIECKRDVAYIPETVMLYGVLSGYENLNYFAALATGERHSREALIGLLKEAGLDPGDADRTFSTPSQGRRSKG